MTVRICVVDSGVVAGGCVVGCWRVLVVPLEALVVVWLALMVCSLLFGCLGCLCGCLLG